MGGSNIYEDTISQNKNNNKKHAGTIDDYLYFAVFFLQFFF